MSGGPNRLFPQWLLGCGSYKDGNRGEKEDQIRSELRPVLLNGVFGRKENLFNY